MYFFVEIITAVLSVLIIKKLGLSMQSVYLLLLVYSLIVLSFIDLKYKAVPSFLLLLALCLALLYKQDNILQALNDAFLFAGAIALLSFLLSFYIQNIKAKLLQDASLKTQEALGEGDIPIFALIGIVLGIKAGLFAIFLASIFAIIPAIYLRIKYKDQETPFIPFLVLGFFCEFLFNISKVF